MESLPENLENLLQQVLDEQEATINSTNTSASTNDVNSTVDTSEEPQNVTTSSPTNTEDVETQEKIPEISKTHFMSDAVSRFQGASWYGTVENLHVTVVGCGGIGSWTTLLVKRLNVKTITLFDNDSVEVNNLSGQLFKRSNAGETKVGALRSLCNEFSTNNTVIATVPERFTNQNLTKVTICGLDNMESRLTVFNRWAELYDNDPEALFIDGRLSAEAFQIFVTQGGNRNSLAEYRKKWLFPDSEGDQTVCSYKQTSFMASMIASFIVNILVNFADNSNSTGKSLLERTVPFYTEYSGDYMFLKTEIL